jgi:hypothetical protein
MNPNNNVNAIRQIVALHEANVGRLENELARLLELRAQECHAIETHLSLNAPIRRLPDKLLAKIFVASLPPGQPFIQPSDREAPLNLTWVCSAWRKIALCMPALWSALSLVCITDHSPIELMEQWLWRSWDRPLSISVCIADAGEPHTQAILNKLATWIDRWRHVKLHIGGEAYLLFAQFHSAFGVAAPILETFELVSKYDIPVMGEEIEAGLNAFLRDAPRLRSFCWHNSDNYRQVQPCVLDLPWAQLSRLEIGRILSFDRILDIFAESPQLVSCAFDRVRHASRSPLTRPLIVLRHLKSMLINSIYDLGPFFDCLLLPALAAIEIGIGYLKDDIDYTEYAVPCWPQTQFLSLLSRSHSPIERLHLDAFLLDNQIIACLEQTSLTLKALGICDRPTSDGVRRVIERLNDRQNGLILCPMLAYIEFRCMGLYEAFEQPIVRTLEAMERLRVSSKPQDVVTIRWQPHSCGSGLPGPREPVISESANFPMVLLPGEGCVWRHPWPPGTSRPHAAITRAGG